MKTFAHEANKNVCGEEACALAKRSHFGFSVVVRLLFARQSTRNGAMSPEQLV